MKRTILDEQRYKQAQKRVNEIKGFYTHLLVYVVINAMLIIASSNWDVLDKGEIHLSGYATALFWGIGLAAHWASVFGPGLFLGKKWEERKIKELLEKDKLQKEKWQ
jgi:hypothetical protein